MQYARPLARQCTHLYIFTHVATIYNACIVSDISPTIWILSLKRKLQDTAAGFVDRLAEIRAR